jgi:signal transduction histidine kinase
MLHAVQSKVETITSSAGFSLTTVGPSTSSSITINVEDDAFVQIAINLVENAVKFSRLVERREVQIGFEISPGSQGAIFFVRDFGPGVPRSERRKIFELFYRREDELTRQTNGTGIGLALVKELARRMHATVDYRSKDPGSEFRVSFVASDIQPNLDSENHDQDLRQ